MGTWRWHIEKQYLHERLKDALLWNKSDKQQWWYMTKPLGGNVYCRWHDNKQNGASNGQWWCRWGDGCDSIWIRVTCGQIMTKTMTCDYKEGKSLRACEIFSTLLGWSRSILRRFSSNLVQIARLIKANFGAAMRTSQPASIWTATRQTLVRDCGR